MSVPAPPFEAFVASAPGKIIISGEHAVVHGTRALATVIDERTFVELAPGREEEGSCRLVVHHESVDDSEFVWPVAELRKIAALCGDASLSLPNSREFEVAMEAVKELMGPKASAEPSALVFVFLYVVFVRGEVPVHAQIRSQLPMGAGLGSSASFCSALSSAFVQLAAQLGLLSSAHFECVPVLDWASSAAASSARVLTPTAESKAFVNLWSYEGERVIHGNPSGVDNTCTVNGGAIVYRRGHDIEFLQRLPPLHILVTNTKVPRDTKSLVAGVGRLFKKHAAMVQHVFDAIEEISMQIRGLIVHHAEKDHAQAEDKTELREFGAEMGDMMRKNQSLLEFLEVGHPAIDAVVRVGDDLGLPTKLTGAGGGGCVASLVPFGKDHAVIDKFQQQMEQLGFSCFESTIGQHGVLVHPGATLDKIWQRLDALSSSI